MNTWHNIIANEMAKPYFQSLKQFLAEEYRTKMIFPPKEHIFEAFACTPYENVKVVLLGQDPYHGRGQAQGLSFSVNESCPVPPSLLNMYKELYNDLGIPISQSGDLHHWAEQGVLLLNTVLTVEEGRANSHQNKGWELFTDHILTSLNQKETSIVFLLFGASAKKKSSLIDKEKHFIITAPHPSPLSAYRGFFDSHPFSRTNEYLANTNQCPIQWELES